VLWTFRGKETFDGLSKHSSREVGNEFRNERLELFALHKKDFRKSISS